MRQKWDLFVELLKTSFKLKYRGSALGFIWVLMKPFAIFIVLYLVFSKIGGGYQELTSSEYAIYLLLGLVVFNFFNESIIWGMNSLLDKAHIILKVKFDKTIAVFSSIALGIVNLQINVLIFVLVASIVGVNTNVVAVLYAVFIFFILMCLVLGISLFTSIILVYLRDLTHVTELGMQLIFYASAVFFPIALVPEKWRFIVHYNPIAACIEAVRNAVIMGEITRYRYIAGMFVLSIITLVLGQFFFKSKIRRIAEFF